MGGAPTHPGWYHNLMANPDATVTVARTEYEVRARRLEGDERERVWERLSATNRVWERYAARTTRILPLVALER